MQNHRQTPVLFGLTSLRTELRKGAHDKARKVARLLDVHASEEAAALDAWKRECATITRKEATK